MTDYQLNNIDPEDIEDLLAKVETSFGIKFVGDELVYITTFGQLCDYIAEKIQLVNSDDCTSQQAFYKLRHAISSILLLDDKTISPDILLANVLPRQARRLRTKKLENHLGFKLNILRPPHWVTRSFAIVLVVSLVELFFNWQTGLLGLIVSVGGLWFAYEIGNELDLKTVGQVAEKMTRERYLESRRNSKTYNKKEIKQILTDWFRGSFDLAKSKLTRGAKL